MKKSTLGIVFAAVALVSCSKSEEGVDKTTREIKLSASVAEVTVKAPINDNFTSDFRTGIYAKNSTWGGGTLPDEEIINDDARVSGSVGHSVIFSKTYYYPVGGETLTFYAYTPYATQTKPYTAGASPEVTIPMDGQQDIMWATGTGDKELTHNPTLRYSHKLTQLQFTFKSGLGFPATGSKVTSLYIAGQPDNAVMTVESGNINFTGSVNMYVQMGQGVEIDAAGTNAVSPIMTKPGASFTAYITVKPANGSPYAYTNVPIVLDTQEGEAHMITFVFNEEDVNATATVAPWASGAGVTVEVQ